MLPPSLIVQIETIPDTEDVHTTYGQELARNLSLASGSELEYLDLHTRCGDEPISDGTLT